LAEFIQSPLAACVVPKFSTGIAATVTAITMVNAEAVLIIRLLNLLFFFVLLFIILYLPIYLKIL
jgi:hypothetical protein